MTLRREFALVNSEFNPFLYASFGDEGNGRDLSVFSALARLDIDPWKEAERLSALSRDKAALALAPVIARLAEGRWAPDDIRDIATRLVTYLPSHAAAAPPAATRPTLASPGRKPASTRQIVAIMVLVFAAVTIAANFFH
jgi:hypothetical protein